jgi:hypothetical protein
MKSVDMARLTNLLHRLRSRPQASAPVVAGPVASLVPLASTAAIQKLKGRFSASPWSYIDILSAGEMFVCCSLWTGFKHIGYVCKDKPEEI